MGLLSLKTRPRTVKELERHLQWQPMSVRKGAKKQQGEAQGSIPSGLTNQCEESIPKASIPATQGCVHKFLAETPALQYQLIQSLLCAVNSEMTAYPILEASLCMYHWLNAY